MRSGKCQIRGFHGKHYGILPSVKCYISTHVNVVIFEKNTKIYYQCYNVTT